VYVSFGSSVVEFLAALAVRVIDAFNAETLYCGGAVSARFCVFHIAVVAYADDV
jgi:hypothetical protein